MLNIDITTTSDEDIKTRFQSFGESLGVMINPLRKGRCIYRCRKLKSLNLEDIHKIESELSFKDSSEVKEYGRCNLKNESVFYGTINPTQIDEAFLTALSESSKLIRKSAQLNYYDGVQFFQVGKWQLLCDLDVVAIIPHPSLLQSKHPYFNFYNDFLSKAKDLSTNSGLKENVHSLALEFMKLIPANENNLYRLTANFSSLILQSRETQGLIYPSVQSENFSGVNIAMLPYAVKLCTELLSTTIYAVIAIGSKIKVFPVKEFPVLAGLIHTENISSLEKGILYQKIINSFQQQGINQATLNNVLLNQIANDNEPYVVPMNANPNAALSNPASIIE